MQTPFIIITATIEAIVQRKSIKMVNVSYLLEIRVFFDFVCLFHIIVGNATMETIISTARISRPVPRPNSPNT